MITLLTPENGAIVCQLQQKHLEYIRAPKNDPTSKVDWLNLREVQDDLSYPEPVVFTFAPAVDGEVVLRHPDGKEQILFAKEGKATVQNLLLDTAYEWYVKAGGETSALSTFRTDAQTPRMLYVDGISNVRDFGGFQTNSGKRIRQGMIYRTSEMDSHVSITPEGIRTLEEELDIRTDLDIRGIKDEPRCPILDQTRVRWVNYPLAAYAEIYNEKQLALYGQAYALLTDEKNYPMIVHCWGGIDRTGTWLYILGGMLGVSEDDLGLDYELSSFSRWGRRSRRSEQFCDFLKGLYEYGSTLQEAATGFMRACGITDAQLDVMRKLLLEEPQ
ncbi:MAG: tyrosine-protein phosphatase [Clostridia bacterium]|nr:tyrosine-protein phosphatase [Clostridia bacterium]